MRILITGVAGFIGFHTAQQLLAEHNFPVRQIIGIDNLNEYYDRQLKQDRLAILQQQPNKFTFIKTELSDAQALAHLFHEYTFDVVIHLAAQAGVRYSLENPSAYVDANLVGFTHLIEKCRQHKIKHFIFASSSSVYGLNAQQPFREQHHTDHPVSLYAATKKANEVIAHSYAHLFNLPCTGIRFFTVYGPWGRPDMAYFKFTQKILAGQPIEVNNHGDLYRDFTYVDDIVAGIKQLITKPATPNPNWRPDNPDPASSSAPYRIYNLGNNCPVRLMDFIDAIEKALDKTAEKIFLPMQAGDVYTTYADVSAFARDFGFSPQTPLQEGINRFVAWFKTYYQKS